MAKAGKVTGEVQYAVGDGPVETIPVGEVELEIAADSTVVTWMAEGESSMTAIPKQDYDRYVAEGLIKVTS